MLPRLNAAETSWMAMLTTALDGGRCFDFDYAPQDGDVLKIRSSERWYRLRRMSGHWQWYRSTSLTGWRAQMVPHSQGRVQNTGS